MVKEDRTLYSNFPFMEGSKNAAPNRVPARHEGLKAWVACRFLNISLGSISELSYALKLGRALGYLKAEEWGETEALRDHAGRLTWGLYRSLDSKRAARG